MAQQIALGGTMIALPIFLQMVLEYNAMKAGLSLAPLSLSMFALALIAGKRAGKRRAADIILAGFGLLLVGLLILLPIVPRAHSGWALVIPLVIAGSGLGLLVSQLNNYTLSPISEERVSEAAGVNSAGGSFGLSFGLAFAGAEAFWGHVGPGADGGVGRCQCGVGGAAGDAEVDEVGEVVVGQQDIGGFDIAVHQPGLVGAMQRRGDLFDDVNCTCGFERPSVEQSLQVGAVDQAHGHIEAAVDLADVVDRHDVRVVQAPCGARLAHKALLEVWILRVVR
jgi:hypothetical protein